VSDGTPGRAGGGLRGALGQLGSSLVGLLRTRLELAALELNEERDRAIEALILVNVAALAFAFAVLAASTLVIVLFWDTHRIAALLAMTIAYLLVGIVAAWRFSRRRPADAPPFRGTLAELERDRAWLADEFGGDR
jgi:uncharacterized membrane protein YqjE